jgi:hypothetical protein
MADQSSSDKLLEVLGSKSAPANHTPKVLYASDMAAVKMLLTEQKDGSINFGDVFGKRLRDDDDRTSAAPLNLGSRKSMTLKNGHGLKDSTRMRLLQLKKLYNNCEIQACVKGQTKHPTKELIKSVPLWRTFVTAAKAFDITDFDVFIDTVQSRFYFEEFEIPQLLADKFDQLPMTSSLVRVPGALGLLEGELESDDGVFTEQANTKSSYIVESKNNVVHVKITQDLLDDSSPAIIDKLRKEVLRGIARSYERALLDGDTTSPHMDDDTAAASAKHFSKAWKGLRRLAFDNETLVGGNAIVFALNDTPSKAMFATLLKKMGCQASEKKDLVYIFGCTVGHDLVTGAIPELFTAFAFGSLASNVTGQVPPVFGVECVESQYAREDLDTDGKTSNPAIGTRTYCLLVQKSRFTNWVRQAPRVWAAPSLPSSDNMLMSSKARHAFAGIPQSANERSVVMAIDVKTA